MGCLQQLLHLRDRLIVDDYTEVLTTLMRYPTVDDPYIFFSSAVTLALAGGRLLPMPDVPALRADGALPISVDELRPRLVSFYEMYCHTIVVADLPLPCPQSFSLTSLFRHPSHPPPSLLS